MRTKIESPSNSYLGTKILGFLLLTAALSCSKSNPLNPLGACANGAVWTEVVSNELNAYNQALQAYSEAPTAENCATVKASAKNYFDALGDVLECVPTTSRAQINQAIEEAKDEVDKEGCD